MNKKELEILLDRYRSGQATAAEKQLLYRHYNDFIKHHNLDDFNESEAESRLSQWSPITKLEPSARRLFPWRQVAAVFAIATFATLFYFRSIRQEDKAATAAALSEPIGAPVTKAIAILPSGDTLLLDGAQESAQKLARIHAKDLAITDQLITLKTPRGGKLHFTLPDGSSVWLNSETTMTYPATFGKESRSVTLQGEAYFEVVKIEQNNGKMPFTVRSEQEEVTVLGTKFNINNYKDEAISTTTLAEGAVAVRQLTESKSTLLKPNQQYISSASGTQVRKINASETVAWKEGVIALSNKDILSIIRMIERNYDVQFGSCVLPKEIRFSGELQTTLALDELLDVLEINLGLQFKREGKIITILTDK